MNIATLLEKLITKKYYANKEDIENKSNRRSCRKRG